MAGFNLIRKRRRRLPVTKILLGVLGIVVVAALGYLALKLSGSEILKPHDVADLTISDTSAMLFFQDVPEGPAFEYTAPGEGQEFARGAVVSFSVIGRGTADATVKLDDISIVVKSFTPKDKLPEQKIYEAPIQIAGVPETDDDATVRITATDPATIKAKVTWTAQAFSTPEGTREVTAEPSPTKEKSPGIKLLGTPVALPLSSLNRPEVKFFSVKVILDTPGVATFGVIAHYDAEGTAGTAVAKDTFSVVYNPDTDVFSTSFYRKAYQNEPTFANARILRDKLVEYKETADVVQIVTDHRSREPGPDSDWLVGSTYKMLGELESDEKARKELFQKACCDGLLAFYRQDQDFPGDRLSRWQSAKDWLTAKVQEKTISLECP